MQKAILVCVSLLLTACNAPPLSAGGGTIARSDIKDDETLVFFRTSARLDVANAEWHIPVHGWVYEPEDSAARKALFTTLLKKQFDLVPDDRTEANYTRRLNLLIADNERGKRVVISIAGQQHEMPDTVANGQFEATLVIAANEVEKYAKNSILQFSAVTRSGESRSFEGEILLVKPAGISVISDIDDTVKISEVTDKKKLLEHTFLLDFSAAPGMARLYRQWSDQDVSLHFVSSSPWQLYAPLDEFLLESGFPRATYSLKQVRFRDETLFNLFKKGTETKPQAIEKILDRYPGRQFVLVGDSGEQDVEVYAALLKRRPDRIVRVYIRNVTEESADNHRFTTLFDGIDDLRWRLFEDASLLALPEYTPNPAE